MSTTRPATTSSTPGDKTYFEQQREILLRDISTSLGHVLDNINKLNRSLEGVIAVGNEFSSVEALWSQFENVMAKDPEAEMEAQNGAEEDRQSEEDGATELAEER